MRTAKLTKSLLTLLMALPLASCNSTSMGTITFELNGGHFTSSNSINQIKGESNTPIKVDFPTAAKDGYYFVGWREKRNGTYSEIHKSKLDDGTEAYLYPYGSTTLYAYFEEEKSISFDVGYTDATLVAPKESAENFDAATKTIKGYVNKSILEDELPTATYDKAKFQYWYTEYPLKTMTQEEGNVTYYVLDTSKEKGEYKFTAQFSLGQTVFPSYSNGETFVLHAKWSVNPTVVLDFNLAGVTEYSYQLSNDEEATFETVVKAGLKAKLNAEYADGKLIYNDKKLAGLYADKSLNDSISLSQKIETDTTIYFKWADKITVTFDFDGGTSANGLSAYTAYQGDILDETVYTAYTPTKENADFLYFTLDDQIYHFGTTVLPNTDCTLKAVYDNYPTLNLTYAFAPGFDATVVTTKMVSYIVKSGNDITAYLDKFKADFATYDLKNSGKALSYYTYQNGQKAAFQGTTMPSGNTSIYLSIGANALVTYKTLDENGNAVDVKDCSGYCSDTDRITDYTFTDTTNDHGISYIKVGEATKQYIYGGLYTDSSMDEDYRITEKRMGQTSADSIPTMTIYRMAIKGIKLTFVDEVGNTIGSCYVAPGDKVSEYSELFASIVGSGKTLTVDGKELTKSLPEEDKTVLVK